MADKRLYQLTELTTPSNADSLHIDRGSAVTSSERCTVKRVVEAGATTTPASGVVPKVDAAGVIPVAFMSVGAYSALQASADLSVTTSTPTLVPGLTLSFTPTYTCRAVVHVDLDCRVDTVGTTTSSLLVGEVFVNTVAQSGQLVFQGQAASARFMQSRKWTVNLTASTLYTIEVKARVNTIGPPANTYTVRLTNSILVVEVVKQL